MKSYFSNFLIVSIVWLLFSNPIFSQNQQFTGKYRLLHNIPKNAYSTIQDTVFEFPLFISNETIELRKNNKARIVIEKDKIEDIKTGTWIYNNNRIELQINQVKLIFNIVNIEDKSHLKLENSEFKYYQKF